MTPPFKKLLAIDLGLRTGLALYDETGHLLWYRSHHYGSIAHLKRAIYPLIQEIEGLAWLIIEGDRLLAEKWERVALKKGVSVRIIGAEAWRTRLLYAREQRSGSDAKRHADAQARKIIEWSEAPRPTSLRHDAAEAILIGIWGLLEVGWLKELPPVLRSR